MFYPNYENLLRGGAAAMADPTASPCGNPNCKSLSITPNAEYPSTNPNVATFHLIHATAAHLEAMKNGGKIEKVDPASVDVAHRCQLEEHGQSSLSIVNVLPIHAACFAGNLSGVREFINEHGKEYVETLRIELDRNVPEFAARGGQLPLLKMLFDDFGMNLDAGNSRGATPVQIAAQEKQGDMVKYLLDVANADPHRKTNKNRNLMSYLIGYDEDLELIKYVHEKHNGVIAPEDNDRLASLLLDGVRLVPKKYFDILAYCATNLGLKFREKYDAGIHEEQPGDDVMPPVVTAALIPDVPISLKVLDLIYSHAPNVDVTSWCGLTALHAAGSAGNIPYVKRIFELGGTIQRNRVGNPLHHCCLSLDAELIRMFIEDHKVDPNWTVPLSEVKPLHLLLSTFKSTGSDADLEIMGKFTRCLQVMLRNGLVNSHYAVPKSYLLPSTTSFSLTPEHTPAYLKPSSANQQSNNSNARPKPLASASARSTRDLRANSGKNQVVEVEEAIVIQNLPLTSVMMCFDYGHCLEGFYPSLSLYNSSTSYSNNAVLRYLHLLGLVGAPDDSVVCPEYGCVGTDPRLFGKHSTAAAGAKPEVVGGGDDEDEDDDSEANKKQGLKLDEAMDQTDEFQKLMKELSAETVAEAKKLIDDKSASSKEETASANGSFLENLKKTTDELAQRRKRFGRIIVGSPLDPTAIATLRQVWSQRTCFGRILSSHSNKNSSFTIDGLVGFTQQVVTDFCIGFLARRGFLCNAKRWDEVWKEDYLK